MLHLYLSLIKYFFIKELGHADCLLVVEIIALREDYLYNLKELRNFNCFASDFDFIDYQLKEYCCIIRLLDNLFKYHHRLKPFSISINIILIINIILYFFKIISI